MNPLTYAKLLGVALANLPAFVRFLEAWYAYRKDAAVKRKVADDMDKITEAFKNRKPGERDAISLNRIFNSKP